MTETLFDLDPLPTVPRTPRTACHWCGTPRNNGQRHPDPWVCRTCLAPIARVAGRLKHHHVHPDTYRRLLTDPTCELCGTDVLAVKVNEHTHRVYVELVVDHDHRCCPGTQSCGACVRGLICHACNLLLGSVGDRPDLLLHRADVLTRAAAYVAARDITTDITAH